MKDEDVAGIHAATWTSRVEALTAGTLYQNIVALREATTATQEGLQRLVDAFLAKTEAATGPAYDGGGVPTADAVDAVAQTVDASLAGIREQMAALQQTLSAVMHRVETAAASAPSGVDPGLSASIDGLKTTVANAIGAATERLEGTIAAGQRSIEERLGSIEDLIALVADDLRPPALPDIVDGLREGLQEQIVRAVETAADRAGPADGRLVALGDQVAKISDALARIADDVASARRPGPERVEINLSDLASATVTGADPADPGEPRHADPGMGS